jgi:hypothetical protein
MSMLNNQMVSLKDNQFQGNLKITDLSMLCSDV